ncbi:MAG: nucleoid-associated protein [Atopobiaceae bacterium]
MLRVNDAILHVFDFDDGSKYFSGSELDLTEKLTKSYVQRRLRACYASPENKHGEFSEQSNFAPELRHYVTGQLSFVDISTEIAQFFWEELRKVDDITPCDLLVADFEISQQEDKNGHGSGDDEESEAAAYDVEPEHRFAVVLLPRKQSFMHTIEHSGGADLNDIVRHDSTLPNPSAKLQSYALIDLKTFAIDFQDVPRSIADADVLLIPNGFLQCSSQASNREVIDAVTQTAAEVADEYGQNAAQAISRAKACVLHSVDLDETVDPQKIGEQVFRDAPQLAERYEEEISDQQLPEQIQVRHGVANRLAKNHKIRTDTGIDITFPSEYSMDSNYMEFINEPDGHISLLIKNIATIENR